MKTSDVRVGETYLHRGQQVKVMERHRGASMKRSSIWASRNPRKRSSFILSNGHQVFSDKLENL